jgi:Protein of unknown function (DUF3800)
MTALDRPNACSYILDMDVHPADGRRVTYLYFDEAGNFDFSPGGTRVFAMTCLVLRRPFAFHEALLDIKYELLESGLNIEYFHASEDKQAVRDRVFGALAPCLPDLEGYSVVLQKRRVDPSRRAPHSVYRDAFERLLESACPPASFEADHVVAITDHVPVNKKRAAFEKALKPYLKKHMGGSASYDLFHHQSRSDLNLQVADYISWAVYRKWNLGDIRSYDLIESCMRSEDDWLSDGPEYY